MINRRHFLGHAGLATLAGIGATLGHVNQVQAADFKAVVVLFLSGGHDGNNVLIPNDGAYGDYSKARPSLALPRDSLVSLSRGGLGHKFSLSPASRPLAELFERERLAIVANAGALIEPTTMDQIRNNTARLPPFMGSHTEQEQWIQGWMGDEDLSGWGGRTMDLLPDEWKQRQPLVAMARDYTAVISNHTSLSLADSNSGAFWGRVNLEQADDAARQRLEWASRLQSGNVYEREFTRSVRTAYLDSMEFLKGQRFGAAPAGEYPDAQIGRDLRYVARHLAYSKQMGARRQFYLVQDGGYDTHTSQLSTTDQQPGLEVLIDRVARSLKAFDQSMTGYGMANDVVTVVMSEFGRTLDPASGVGSDHAWGNHWFAMGGAVKGGQIYGKTFPRLQVGGPDDASNWDPRRGQWLPQFSSDQFMADVMQWMGLTPAQALVAMPNLANFPQRTIGYL